MADKIANVVASLTGLEVTYFMPSMGGGTSLPSRRNSGWSAGVMEKKDALIAAAQDAATGAGLGYVQFVEIYGPKSNDAGRPPYTGPGETVDVKFFSGGARDSERLGDNEYVPVAIAEARDALKAAIEAEI